MKIMRITVLAISSLMMLTSVQAADDIKVTRSGIGKNINPYFGLSFGNADYSEAGNSDVAIGFVGGIDLDDVLAVEISFNDFGDGGNSSASVQASAIGLAIVGKVPFTTELTGFAQIGMSSWKIDANNTDDSGRDIFYGLGMDYNISGDSAVRFGLNFYPMDADFSGVKVDEEVQVFNVGFVYKL
jgi:hypothetical protein